jgi:hypothetical protein
MIRYKHKTAVGTRFSSRNERIDGDGSWPWYDSMQSWLNEPRIYVHRRRIPGIMSALAGRKDRNAI